MQKNSLSIHVDSVSLEAILQLQESPRALVIFAHGSGSSRLSPRNNYVASILHKAGLSTLLSDLLTENEDEIYENRFNIPLLAKRLSLITDWVRNQAQTKKMNLGYFGASTGAAAALMAASKFGKSIGAIVSRGGRPDMAKEVLPEIFTPTLLIVGGNDEAVIELNRFAYNLLGSEKKLEIIPGATHLFEEPGTLDKVADLAADWFVKYLLE